MKTRTAGLTLPTAGLPVLALLALPASAFAHPGLGGGGGLWQGVAHPLSGLDHVCAMVAVGLWAAQRGGPSRPAVGRRPTRPPDGRCRRRVRVLDVSRLKTCFRNLGWPVFPVPSPLVGEG